MFKGLFIGKKILQPFFERLYRISLRGMNYGTAGFIESSGEVNLIRNLTKYLKPKKDEEIIIFDVGSNKGEYVSAILKNLNHKGKIHCFEPSAFTYKKLIEIESSKRIELYFNNFGLGNVNEIKHLYYDYEGSGWASLFPIEHKELGVRFENKEKVELRTLDDYCVEKKIKKIDFLKMDIEGFELNLLKGSSKMLMNGKIRFIQFEFGLANLVSKIILRDFFEMLSEYKIYRILQDGLYEIHYNERYELFLTTNYLAVHKSEVFQ